MRLLRRSLLPAVLVLALVPALASAAHMGIKDTKPDPDAPAGAPLFWLPDEDWVLEHWLPYDFRRLQRAMGGMEFKDILAYVHDNVHTLDDLSREKGRKPKAVRRYLLAPWRGEVSKARYRVLKRRTRRTFTQAHLFQHMIGHPFHTRSLQRKAKDIFGMTSAQMVPLRHKGMSFAQIAAHELGRDLDEVVALSMRQLRRTAREAVRTKQSPRAWATFWLDLQEERLPGYLTYEPPAKDGSGPGSADHGHGHGDPPPAEEPTPEPDDDGLLADGLESFGEQPGTLAAVATAVGRNVVAMIAAAVHRLH